MLGVTTPAPAQQELMILAIQHALHVAINALHAFLQQPTALHVEATIEDHPHLVPVIMGTLMLEHQIAKHATTTVLLVSGIQLIVKAAMVITEDQPLAVPAQLAIMMQEYPTAKLAYTPA